jgi:hypothetical protein
MIEEGGERVAESIASGCLTWPLKYVPVLLGHDEKRRVGFVTDVRERDGWHEATFVLDMDKPLARVALGLLHVGAPVSIGARSLATDTALANLGTATPIKRHLVAVLEEVSIVEPGYSPQYRGAKVTKIVERESVLQRHHRERQEREARKRETSEGEVMAGGRVIRREFKTPITFRNKRGEVIRNEIDGSQSIWCDEAAYGCGTSAPRVVEAGSFVTATER